MPIAAIANNTVTTAMLTSAGVIWQTRYSAVIAADETASTSAAREIRRGDASADDPITSPRLPIPTRQIDIVNTRL